LYSDADSVQRTKEEAAAAEPQQTNGEWKKYQINIAI
jgi:hypothetical protein